MDDVRRKQREKLINAMYQLDLYQVKEEFLELDEESLKIYNEVLSSLEIIDQLIEQSLFDYTLKRLSYLDRAIIRYATYELKYTEIPFEVIINEAIEITKKYTDLDDEKQHKFNNKVLDNISKMIGR